MSEQCHHHPEGAGAHVHVHGDACCPSELSIVAQPSSQAEHASRAQWYRLFVALAFAGVAEAFAFAGPDTVYWKAGGMLLAAVAIGLAGLSVLRSGLAALTRGDLNINALMSVAVIGAFLIGEWPEAAMVMALYSLAELIEDRSVDRARNAIKSLLDISPPSAQRRTTTGEWEEVPASQVTPGDIVRVRPGERLPLDGRVTAGRGSVNQAPVTGESMPVEKVPGDEVYAGTINLEGGLELEVTAAASDTVLARIIHAVEQAQSRRAPTQRFIDRFASIYTPVVFLLAVVVAVGGPLLFGLAWLDSVYRALVLLVIACPCALVISTPVTVVSGLAAAAGRGILIKGGVYLEQARKLRIIAFDKTGTITQGRPRLVAHETLTDAMEAQRILRIAAGLASRSDHPVSQAIAEALTEEAAEVVDFGAEAGRGVQGMVDGNHYRLASHRRIHELGMCSEQLEERLSAHEKQGRTVSLLAGSQGVLALFAVADTVRDSARQAVAELQHLGLTPVMLTGDNAATAKNVAMQAGINTFKAELLPDEKLVALKELHQSEGAVAMVGDGINDAPALAAAAVGFAMGGVGTHTAMEAADVVIMNDDLRRVPETIRLSRRTQTVLWQNIGLALGIKAIFLALALFDHATMWMAVFADMGASLLVVFNGLRLLRSRQYKSGI